MSRVIVTIEVYDDNDEDTITVAVTRTSSTDTTITTAAHDAANHALEQATAAIVTAQHQG